MPIRLTRTEPADDRREWAAARGSRASRYREARRDSGPSRLAHPPIVNAGSSGP